MNGLKEFSLVTAEFTSVDLSAQRRVFVNKPRLTKYVCGCIFQLDIHNRKQTTELFIERKQIIFYFVQVHVLKIRYGICIGLRIAKIYNFISTFECWTFAV